MDKEKRRQIWAEQQDYEYKLSCVEDFLRRQREYHEAKRAREAELARREREYHEEKRSYEARRAREAEVALREREHRDMMLERSRMDFEDQHTRSVQRIRFFQENSEKCERILMEFEDNHSRARR
jgi:hypothetical protein